MNQLKIVVLSLTMAIAYQGQAQVFKDALNKGKAAIGGDKTSGLTNGEVVEGLKEALTIGAQTASKSAAQVDGFYKNPAVFIPWPAEAKGMRDKLVQFGMEKKVLEFEESMNRAAEEASKQAVDILIGAVKGMSVSDGFAILRGSDTAATHYLRQTTFDPLKVKFEPIIQVAIEKVKVTSYWNSLVTTYNRIPGVQKQNPDIVDYVNTKAVNGLMILISQQEAKIRQDPGAQVTDLLKKVFGGGR
jgi:hypothetical protein